MSKRHTITARLFLIFEVSSTAELSENIWFILSHSLYCSSHRCHLDYDYRLQMGEVKGRMKGGEV